MFFPGKNDYYFLFNYIVIISHTHTYVCMYKYMSHQILIMFCSIAQKDESLNSESADMSGDTESLSVTERVAVWVSAGEKRG